MKILLIDDHAVMRTGLRRILLDEFHSAEIGEAADAEEA
ncbi:MAG: DNA-binding response regulator, partial [Betaproteobacteria bacterium]|nr:DNA-binding response regulator [Betaproteobacteria bacterium]